MENCTFSLNVFHAFRRCIPIKLIEETDPSWALPPVVIGFSVLTVLATTMLAERKMGDIVNVLVLLNTAAFMTLVIAHNAGFVDAGFSSSFNRNGFCVANEDSPLIQSHVLCFYVDSLCALVLMLIVRQLRGKRGLEPVAVAASGIFGHGVAHLFTWQQMQAGEPVADLPGFQTVDALTGTLGSVGLGIFFFLLLRTVPSMPQQHAIFHAAFHGIVLALLVRPRFAFTYVNTILMFLAVTYDLLMTREKDRYYCLAAAMINFPVTQVAWIEGFACETFFKRAGGHVWYDAIIPLSMFAYCAVALPAAPTKNKAA